jgi:hypothetical protein
MAKREEEAKDWFINKARSAAGYRKNIVGNDDRGRDEAVIGKMYFFYYDPKMKKTLPVYDRFPLVFPIERYSDGFLGLNMHYLSQGERSALLSRLMEFKSNSRMNELTKIRMSYDLLSNTKKLANAARPCIKRYLFSHVRSKFVEVIASEWEQAIALPVELFVRKG